MYIAELPIRQMREMGGSWNVAKPKKLFGIECNEHGVMSWSASSICLYPAPLFNQFK